MEEDRARAMAARLETTASLAGLRDRDVDRIVRCYEYVIGPRMRAFGDPRHPDLLHPARTALILLEDVQLSDADAIAAGMLHDSRRSDLSTTLEAVRDVAGARAADLAAQFPARDADPLEIREALVTADPNACLAALAEQLDHARHLHLAGAEEWPAVFARTAAFLPVARRAHPRLGARYVHWVDVFEQRYIRRGTTEPSAPGGTGLP